MERMTESDRRVESKTWNNNPRSTETRRESVPILAGAVCLPTAVPRTQAPRWVGPRRHRLGHSLPISKGWSEISPLICRPGRRLNSQKTTNAVDRCINKSPYAIASPMSGLCTYTPENHIWL